MSADIAIIGMSGVYAGAADVPAFWHNILHKVDAITAADAEWTGPYLDPDSDANDRIYTNRGGFLKDLARFAPAEFGIMPNAIDGGEPDQYLALRLARDALADAGYLDRDFDRNRAGVVLGRGTYVNRGYGTLMQHGQVIDQTLALLRQLRPDLDDGELKALRGQLKDSIPAFNTAMAPGLVPNIVSGLICNRLNLMGPNHIIDAACASTLIAVDVAMRELASGRADLMLSGGIQAHTPPQIYMIFCQLGALSRGALRPFDAKAGGTLLGEGAGLVVLKRCADAERDGDRIYAVIRGYGASSDGRAKGLLAPRKEGEVLAMRRALADADIDPATVGLIEAHGTGIALGDQTEIESLGEVFGARRGDAPRIAIGSVKSMISHCIPAAGSASIIKTALALHQRILPPTLCDEVNPALGLENTPFYVNTETRPWVHGGPEPRRAGINAFGFGGVNAHLLLEEYRPADAQRYGVPARPLMREAAAADGELVVLAADSREALIDALASLRAGAEAGEPLPVLAARQAAARGVHRLAVVASDSADLADKLARARERLARADGPFRTRGGLHYGCGAPAGKLAVLFPGEGAQYPGMLAELALRFPALAGWLDFLEQTVGEARGYRASDALLPAPTALTDEQREALAARLYDMDLASESVFAASQGLWAVYRALGLEPDAMLGHSTGENSALVASGALAADSPEALAGIAAELNARYRELADAGEIVEGSLLTIGGVDAATRDRVLAEAGDALVLAMDNCPNQSVVFGAPDAVEHAGRALREAGAICAELPFGRAYHTAAFQPVAEAFRRYYAELPIAAPRWPLLSCATAAPFPDEADAIRDLACSQWARPVRFRETVEALYADGVRLFLEVGPSANLSSFVGDVLKGREDVTVLASNSRRQPALKSLLGTLGALYAAGVELELGALFDGRTDIAPPASRPKGEITLKLAMPQLALTAVPAMPAAPAAVRAESPPVAAGAEPSPATPASPPSPPADARQQALSAHFELMQEFLASQQRIYAQLGGAPEAAAAPPPPAPDAPAPAPLITRIERTGENALTAVCELDPQRHRYLDDHRLGRPPSAQDPALSALAVLPFTFSMELLAEAAGQLAPAGWHCRALSAVRGHRWLALDAGPLDLKLTVERLAGGTDEHRYAGRIETSDGAAGPAFEAELSFAPAYATPPAPAPWRSEQQQPPRRNPPEELYRRGMFHGPRLQGVQALTRWGERTIEAELACLPRDDYLADDSAPVFQTEPALLDAAGQLAGYWLSEKYGQGFNCFPFRLERFEQFAPPPPAGTKVLCRGDIVEDPSAGQFSVQWDLIGADGTLLARATGWTDRRFEIPPRYLDYRLAPRQGWLSERVAVADLPQGLCLRRLDDFGDGLLTQGGGIWGRVLAHLVLCAAEREEFAALPAHGPRRAEWLLGRIAAKEAARDWLATEYGLTLASADLRIVADAGGKPRIESAALAGRPAPAVSLSHAGGQAWAVAGEAPLDLGLDHVLLGSVAVDDLLDTVLSANEQALIDSRDPARREQRVLALWAAKEAVAKATGHGLGGRPGDFVVTSAAFEPRDGRPATARVHHRGADYAVQWLAVSPPAIVALASTIHFARSAAASTAPQGQTS